MLAWQVLFLSASSSRMHMPGLCACEREGKEAEGPASATGRREAAGKIRCWMTKYRRGGMTEE